ncbi:MAG: hypothetical protein LUD79_00465 [Oscillospiraceae bacterium]|nr:hypothetical protein [Oscillospiraceae bacterium]
MKGWAMDRGALYHGSVADREKVSLLIDFGKERFPQTVELYQEFVGKQRCKTDISSWRLLDFLLFFLP